MVSVCHYGMCAACESDVLESVHGLRCLIQGALYNELKDRTAAEKVRDIDTSVCCIIVIIRMLTNKQ